MHFGFIYGTGSVFFFFSRLPTPVLVSGPVLEIKLKNLMEMVRNNVSTAIKQCGFISLGRLSFQLIPKNRSPVDSGSIKMLVGSNALWLLSLL